MQKIKNIRKINFTIITLIVSCIILVSIVLSNTIYAKNADRYKILVDVEESKMYVLKENELYKTYSCAGGMESTPSPIGTWEIIEKGKWGEGFGGRWMGFNVPWGEFGIHGTTQEDSVGWNSSHGCIRMNKNDIEEVYNLISIGTKVTVTNGPYGSFGKGFRNLKSGMYGSDVLEIQEKLKEEGFLKLDPDGKFGKETEEAIKKYCAKYNLYNRKTADIKLQEHMGFTLFD